MICADAARMPLKDEVVQCIVTSPPYWGLRKYAGNQTRIWGGDFRCQHDWEESMVNPGIAGGRNQGGKSDDRYGVTFRPVSISSSCFCSLCHAWYGAFGLEPMPQLYIEHSMMILKECWRVLRKDGVLWWNLGDSYIGGGQGKDGKHKYINGLLGGEITQRKHELKSKDLALIPERFVIAAQEQGWYVRGKIVWHKPNSLPESVKDRPTRDFEMIFLLAKTERYYWNYEAGREVAAYDGRKITTIEDRKRQGTSLMWKAGARERWVMDDYGNHWRNLRSVWTFPTQPFSGSHFSTFPEEIPRRCLLVSTRQGDIVLDPFGGSGTVAKVAYELRRKPILVDLAYRDGGYESLARQRSSIVQQKIFI